MKYTMKMTLVVVGLMISAGSTGYLFGGRADKESSPVELQPRLDILIKESRNDWGNKYAVTFDGTLMDTAYWEYRCTSAGYIEVDSASRSIYIHEMFRRPDRWYPQEVIFGDTIWCKKVPCVPYCIPK